MASVHAVSESASNQGAISVQSECNQCAIKVQSECNQSAIRERRAGSLLESAHSWSLPIAGDCPRLESTDRLVEMARSRASRALPLRKFLEEAIMPHVADPNPNPNPNPNPSRLLEDAILPLVADLADVIDPDCTLIAL